MASPGYLALPSHPFPILGWDWAPIEVPSVGFRVFPLLKIVGHPEEVLSSSLILLSNAHGVSHLWMRFCTFVTSSFSALSHPLRPLFSRSEVF